MLISFPLLRTLAAGVLSAGLLAGGVLAAAPAPAASFLRGPDPTVASISATKGPLATTTKRISGNFQFGSGTVYYPTSRAQGTYGVVAIVPGFVSAWSQIAWLGPRLASQGFVVIGIDTSTPIDPPSSRANQFTAAIAAAKNDPAISAVGDFTRVALAGWSMGGGGAMDAAATGNYKAVIPIAPWETVNPAPKITEPTLIFAGQGDFVAPGVTMSDPFYAGLRGPKGLVEIAGGSHFFPTTPNTPMAAAMIAWLKTFVDSDPRYAQFICPKLAVSSGTSMYKSSCSG